MKLIINLLVLISSLSTLSSYGFGCSTCSSFMPDNPLCIRAYGYGSCQCSDPSCRVGANPCLDPALCCEVFGNIGGHPENLDASC